jgi:poly(A) polymerase
MMSTHPSSVRQGWTAPAFPLKAADLMQRGVDKGPALGAAMRAAEEAWVAANFPEDAAEIAAIADAVTKT